MHSSFSLQLHHLRSDRWTIAEFDKEKRPNADLPCMALHGRIFVKDAPKIGYTKAEIQEAPIYASSTKARNLNRAFAMKPDLKLKVLLTLRL